MGDYAAKYDILRAGEVTPADLGLGGWGLDFNDAAIVLVGRRRTIFRLVTGC